jgi:hypothetical protein
MSEESKIVKASIRENIIEQRIRSVVVLKGRPRRIIVSVKVPSRYIENGRWISGGGRRTDEVS